MVGGCRVLHCSATGSTPPKRLRASPLRQDQNHRAGGSELPEFVPTPRDKGSQAIRVSALWKARTCRRLYQTNYLESIWQTADRSHVAQTSCLCSSANVQVNI